MSPSISKPVLLLALLGCLLLTVSVRQTQALELLRRREQNMLETFVINQIESSARSINCHEDGLYKYMDNIAQKLSSAVSGQDNNGEQILKELQGAINMVDLLNYSTADGAAAQAKPIAKPSGFKETPRPNGLLDALGANKAESNKNLVHADRKLSEQGLADLETFAQSSTVPVEEFIKFYTDPRWNINTKLNKQTTIQSSKIQAVKSFLINNFETGASWADQFYMSVEFMEHLPIIGAEVSKLKEKGQGIYDLIRTVRSLKSFIENYRSKDKKLDLNLASYGKKLLSVGGAEALKLIALKMMEAKTGIKLGSAGLIAEVGRRCAYYMLMQLAPKCSSG